MRRRLVWSLLLGLLASLVIAWVAAYRTTTWANADASLQTIVLPQGTMSFFWLDRPCAQLLLARWQPESVVDAHHRGGESKLLTTIFVYTDYYYRLRPYVSDPSISSAPRWSGALGWARAGLLAADVRMIGDSGGKAPQWAKGVSGANNVARTIGAISSLFFQIGGTIEKHVVNGQTGAILRDRDGRVLNTWTLDVLDGQVQTIRTVLNPDKLAHMGPVADAWAILREANEARRPRQ